MHFFRTIPVIQRIRKQGVGKFFKKEIQEIFKGYQGYLPPSSSLFSSFFKEIPTEFWSAA